MVTEPVTCVRCRKVVIGWFGYPDGNYCPNCHYFKSVLDKARGLNTQQQAELIAELQKGD